MSALSTFMEALQQASKETPPEFYASHQGHRNHEKLADTIPGSFTTHNGLAQDHVSEGNGDIRPSAAMAQGANRDAHATEDKQQTTCRNHSVLLEERAELTYKQHMQYRWSSQLQDHHYQSEAPWTTFSAMSKAIKMAERYSTWRRTLEHMIPMPLHNFTKN